MASDRYIIEQDVQMDLLCARCKKSARPGHKCEDLFNKRFEPGIGWVETQNNNDGDRNEKNKG